MPAHRLDELGRPTGANPLSPTSSPVFFIYYERIIKCSLSNGFFVASFICLPSNILHAELAHPDLSPGSLLPLLFKAAASTTVVYGDRAYYDDFVTAQAQQQSPLLPSGITWRALVNLLDDSLNSDMGVFGSHLVKCGPGSENQLASIVCHQRRAYGTCIRTKWHCSDGDGQRRND